MGILQARILEWVAMPPAGDFPNQGIGPESLTSPALAGEFFATSTTWEAHLGILPIGYMCPNVEAHCQGLNIPYHTFVVFCKRSLRSERFSWLVKGFHCPRLFLQRLGLGASSLTWCNHRVTLATSGWNGWLGSPSGVHSPYGWIGLAGCHFSRFLGYPVSCQK